MHRTCIAVFAIVGLVGCHAMQRTAQPTPSSDVSHVRELLVARGGPKITSIYEAGRVEAKSDTDSNDSIPGYMTVEGIKIMDGGTRTVGIAFHLVGPAARDSKETLKSSSVIMDAEEVSALRKVFQQEIEYVAERQKKPSQHHEFMSWQSVEGMSISVSPNSSNESFFGIGINKSGSDSLDLSLSLDAGKQLMVKIDAALKLASENE